MADAPHTIVCCISSSDCREPMSYLHILNSAAQSEPAHQSDPCDRRRTLPALPRGVRQQDLEEHLALRSRRPPCLWTRARHTLRLRRYGVRQQLRVPSLKHGHYEN